MNTKLVVKYLNSSGLESEVIEYHNNSTAAYTASEGIIKRLGYSCKILNVQFTAVKKHLELVPEVKLSQSVKLYGEV